MINWLYACEEMRAELYIVVKLFLDDRVLRWERVFSEIYGNVGDEDLNNLRKGTLSRKKSNQIAKWFEQNHPEVLEPLWDNPLFTRAMERPIHSRFEPNEPDAWDELLAKHSVREGVGVVLADSSHTESAVEAVLVDTFVVAAMQNVVAKVEPSGVRPKPKMQISLGVEFAFWFELPLKGYVLALQQDKGVWSPLPIDGQKPYCRLGNSEQSKLPLSVDGAPGQLVELDEPGYRSFAFIVTEREVPALLSMQLLQQPSVDIPTLNSIANWLTGHAGSFRVHWIGVSFRF